MSFEKRIKNYGLWLSVIALVPMVLQAFGVDILPSNYKEVTAAVLGIFVLLGLVNDPTTSNSGFVDDKKSE